MKGRFTKDKRLLTREDFKSVFDKVYSKNGRFVKTSFFILYYTFDERKPRLGISISGKVVRKAHERNYIKRVSREFFRLNQNNLHGDLLIRWVKKPEKLDFASIIKPLEVCIQKQNSKTT